MQGFLEINVHSDTHKTRCNPTEVEHVTFIGFSRIKLRIWSCGTRITGKKRHFLNQKHPPGAAVCHAGIILFKEFVALLTSRNLTVPINYQVLEEKTIPSQRKP